MDTRGLKFTLAVAQMEPNQPGEEIQFQGEVLDANFKLEQQKLNEIMQALGNVMREAPEMENVEKVPEMDTMEQDNNFIPSRTNIDNDKDFGSR